MLMDEAQIADRLQQKASETQYTHTPAPEMKGETGFGSAEVKLDEIVQYKLAQHFGEDYNEHDVKNNQQLSYIYNDVAERLGTHEYPLVVAKINELKRMLGLNNADNSRYKLYQWLKLDQKRSKIELEMDNVRYG